MVNKFYGFCLSYNYCFYFINIDNHCEIDTKIEYLHYIRLLEIANFKLL